jgi:hypothetical protein
MRLNNDKGEQDMNSLIRKGFQKYNASPSEAFLFRIKMFMEKPRNSFFQSFLTLFILCITPLVYLRLKNWFFINSYPAAELGFNLFMGILIVFVSITVVITYMIEAEQQSDGFAVKIKEKLEELRLF